MVMPRISGRVGNFVTMLRQRLDMQEGPKRVKSRGPSAALLDSYTTSPVQEPKQRVNESTIQASGQ